MKLIDLLVEDTEKIKQPNGGLVMAPISESAHILGSAPIQLDRINPSGQYTQVSIKTELQKVQDGEDSYFCVIFSTNSNHEIVYKYRYSDEIDFSEVFGGIGCGVTRGRGTSYENYFEFVRKNFCAWESEMPFASIRNLDELYATKIPADLMAKAKSRLANYEIKYQFLPDNEIATLLDASAISPITAAVEGRYVFKNGKVVNADGSYCHSIDIVGYIQGDCWLVLDSETLQLVKFDWNYKFNSPSVHSIKKTTVDITQYEGKFVKGDKPEIFLVKDGQKHSCINKETGYAFGLTYGKDGDNWIKLPQSTIDLIPDGAPLDIADSQIWGFVKTNWSVLKVMCEPASALRVEAKLADEKQVEENYNQGILNLITNIFNSMGKLFGGLVKRYPKLGSSVDPEKLSLTIQGFASYAIPLVIWIATSKGFNLQADDVTSLVTTLTTVFATVVTLVGLIRKIWVNRRG